jgi:hypothetical protein
MPAGILLLIFILTIWNPANLALQAASTLSSIGSRSTVSIVILVTRFLITSVGLAAGIALSLRRPGAIWLAKLALALFAIEAVARLSTRVDLGSAPPGTRLPLAIFVVAHNAAWFAYIGLSRRVSAVYGLESRSRSDSAGLQRGGKRSF